MLFVSNGGIQEPGQDDVAARGRCRNPESAEPPRRDGTKRILWVVSVHKALVVANTGTDADQRLFVVLQQNFTFKLWDGGMEPSDHHTSLRR